MKADKDAFLCAATLALRRIVSVRRLIAALCILLLSGCVEEVSSGRPRKIIDVHLHTIPAAWSADTTPVNPATGRPSKATTGADLLPETLKEMEAFNVELGLLSGPLESVKRWKEAAPDLFVGAPQFPMTHRGTSRMDLRTYLPDPEEVRQAVLSGQVGVLGEITAQYAGMVPSDQILEPYFALAAELDLPVGIHSGDGTIVILNSEDRKKFRVDYGNPKWVNEILARYPGLRVYLMHAGYPFLEDTVALMRVYENVYGDLSRINWGRPRASFHDYLRRLIDAGLEKRLMFGSDGVGMPEAIALAVEGIESADFLTEQQKEDIFYNNAARFLRLEQSGTPAR